MVAAIVPCSVEDAYGAFFGEGSGDEIAKPLDFEALFPQENEEEEDEPEPATVVLGPDFISAKDSLDAIKYLYSRGVASLKIVEDYQLKYNAAMHAVIFPVMRDGKTYGWQARKIDPKEGELRLISQQSFSKAKFLLNYDRAKMAQGVIVVEGPFDCLHAELPDHDITGVASLGKNISQDQIKLILDLPTPRIYLGLDPDASKEVYEVLRKIGLGKTVFRIWPPKDRKDFGECTRGEVLQAVVKAIPITCQSDVLDVYLK